MSNHKLIEMLENFTPGNLIEQVNIIEEIDTLLNKEDMEDKEKEVLTHVSQKFQLLIKGGPQKKIVDAIKILTSALKAKKSKSSKNEISRKDDRIIIEDMDILTSFISETSEHLDNIEVKIVSLENNADSETINEIFR